MLIVNAALKTSPSKKRCNSITALKATSQEVVCAVSQEWKDEKHGILAEGQSYASLDEEGTVFQINSIGNVLKVILYNL